MKKVLLGVAIGLAILLCIGSFADYNIDLVKNGTMNFNKTLTVGQALDNWEYCTNGKWDNFQTNNGIEVVEFGCETENLYKHFVDKKLNLDMLKKEISTLSKPYSTLKLLSLKDIADVKVRYIFQFTLNNDDTFQIDNIQQKYIFQDGIEGQEMPTKYMKLLKIAYNNEDIVKDYMFKGWSVGSTLIQLIVSRYNGLKEQ